MKRDKYFESKKKFFDLETKLEKNNQAQRALGWIELDEPVFNGYSRKFVLRDDIKNRKDGYIYQDIVDSLGVTVYSRRKDFIHKNYKGRPYEVFPYFKMIRPDKYDSLSPRMKREFSAVYDKDHMVGDRYMYQVNTPLFFFVPHRSKEYITKVRAFDGELLKEEADLEKQMKFINPVVKRNWRTKDKWTAPKWYRKHLHRGLRNKSKRDIRDILDEVSDGNFNYNGKDGSWYR